MAKRKIVFRPDKKVDVTIGKETQTFTPEEYKKYNEAFKAKSRFGENAPAVKDQKTTALFKEQEIIKAQEQQEKALDIQQTNISAAERTAEKENIPENQLPPLEEFQKNIPKEAPVPLAPSIGYGKVGTAINVLSEASPPNIIIDTLMGKKTEGRTLALGTMAEVWDISKTLFSRKKPIKYLNAKETLDFTTDSIKAKIANAKLGEDYLEAEKDFQIAMVGINRLENSTKFLGTLNLNFWIDDGLSIETEIEAQRKLLEDLREDLNLVKQKQRLASVGYNG